MASDYDAYDAILHRIFEKTQGEAWFKPNDESGQVSIRVIHSIPASVGGMDAVSTHQRHLPSLLLLISYSDL
jgi:hypothetical protein